MNHDEFKARQHQAEEDQQLMELRAEPKVPYNLMSKNDLIREVRRLNGLLDKVDMAETVRQALEKRAEAARALASTFKHREAFMLMTYVSEPTNASEERQTLMVWNSRDGVTPFVCHVNGRKFQHDMKAIQGPFFDRPENCDAQWETRTVKQMMEAWERSLTRAALAGRIDAVQKLALQGDVETAKSHWLFIGMRDLATGRFTDDF